MTARMLDVACFSGPANLQHSTGRGDAAYCRMLSQGRAPLKMATAWDRLGRDYCILRVQVGWMTTQLDRHVLVENSSQG